MFTNITYMQQLNKNITKLSLLSSKKNLISQLPDLSVITEELTRKLDIKNKALLFNYFLFVRKYRFNTFNLGVKNNYSNNYFYSKKNQFSKLFTKLEVNKLDSIQKILLKEDIYNKSSIFISKKNILNARISYLHYLNCRYSKKVTTSNINRAIKIINKNNVIQINNKINLKLQKIDNKISAIKFKIRLLLLYIRKLKKGGKFKKVIQFSSRYQIYQLFHKGQSLLEFPINEKKTNRLELLTDLVKKYLNKLVNLTMLRKKQNIIYTKENLLRKVDEIYKISKPKLDTYENNFFINNNQKKLTVLRKRLSITDNNR